MSESKEFFAFISYKREDEKWAKWLQRKLENFRLPAHLKGRDDLPKEIRPIFKDTSELIPGNLPEQIIEALEHSKFLIVICSPRSASSPWVNAEIDEFIKMGGTDRVIPFIIEGVPYDPLQECFPQALRDLKNDRDKEILGTSIHEMGKEAALVKVVSRMLDLRFDVLWQRHERYLRRRRAFVLGMILTALLAAITFSAIIARQYAQLKKTNWEVLRNESLMLAEKAERLVEEGDSFSAITLALDALPGDLANPERPYTTEAEAALRKALEGNALIQENAAVESVAISPDGKMIASVSYDADAPVKIWDSNTGEQIYIPWPGEEFIESVAFSPKGETLVTAGMFIEVFDMNHLERKRISTLFESVINDLAFSPDGDHLAAACDDSLYVLSMDSCRVFKTLHHPGGTIRSIEFSPDGNQIVSCSEKRVIVLNALDWHEEHVIELKDGEAWTARFSPDGKSIAIGMADNTVRIWNSDSRRVSSIIRPATSSANPVVSLAFSPDGESIAFCAGDRITLWGPDGESRVYTGHVGEVQRIAFSRDGRRIVSASSDHTVRIWNVSSGQRMRILAEESESIEERPSRSHSIAFSPDGGSIVAGVGARLVQWDAETGKQLHSYDGHSGAVTSFVFNQDGKRLFSTGEDGFLRSWDTMTGQEYRPPIRIDSLAAVGFSSARKAVVTVSEKGPVILWDVESGDRIATYTDDTFDLTYVHSLAVSPDGLHAVIGTEDGGYQMDLGTGSCDYLYAKDVGWLYTVHSVAISPNGDQAATDRVIWDLEEWNTMWPTGIPLSVKGNRRIRAVAFSPDSKRVVLGDDGSLISIWDPELDMEIVSYQGHRGPVTAVAFSPDGSRIVSSDINNTVCVWSYLPLQDLINKARDAFDWHGPPRIIP